MKDKYQKEWDDMMHEWYMATCANIIKKDMEMTKQHKWHKEIKLSNTQEHILAFSIIFGSIIP